VNIARDLPAGSDDALGHQIFDPMQIGGCWSNTPSSWLTAQLIEPPPTTSKITHPRIQA